MSVRRLVAFAFGIAIVAIAACKDQGPDRNACRQSYGFGNYGCADVSGTVLNNAEQPVANAKISAGGSTDPYDHFDTVSDAAGHFKVRLLRRWISPAPDMDTVSTWIHASVTTPAPASDSTFTQIRFYRLEHVPTATSVVIHVTTP